MFWKRVWDALEIAAKSAILRLRRNIMKTGRSYNFGRKLDGTKATEEDWDKWREEFWEQEAKLAFKWDAIEYKINPIDDIDI